MQDIADSTGKTLVMPTGRNVEMSTSSPLGRIGPKLPLIKKDAVSSNMTDEDWQKYSRGGAMVFRPNTAIQDTLLPPTQRGNYLQIIKNMLQKK